MIYGKMVLYINIFMKWNYKADQFTHVLQAFRLQSNYLCQHPCIFYYTQNGLPCRYMILHTTAVTPLCLAVEW